MKTTGKAPNKMAIKIITLALWRQRFWSFCLSFVLRVGIQMPTLATIEMPSRFASRNFDRLMNKMSSKSALFSLRIGKVNSKHNHQTDSKDTNVDFYFAIFKQNKPPKFHTKPPDPTWLHDFGRCRAYGTTAGRGSWEMKRCPRGQATGAPGELNGTL